MTFAEKLKGLLERSTPGPWACFPNSSRDPNGEWSVDSQAKHWALIQHNEKRLRGDGDEAYEVIADSFVDGRDAEIIVALVNAAPALVRLLEKVERRRDGVCDHGVRIVGACDCDPDQEVEDALDELDKEASR